MPKYRPFYSGAHQEWRHFDAKDDMQALILARSMGGRNAIITRLLRDDGEGAGWVLVFPEGDKPPLPHPPSLDPRDFIEMPKIGG
jgi:hypothetical protein